MLREHAGRRERVVDEHMFRVGDDSGPTFRVQVFIASGLRPVAVVTQLDNEGMSLTNGAERYAAAVWKRYLPAELLPPIWIARQLMTYGTSEIQKDHGFKHVEFEVTGHGELVAHWGPILNVDEMSQLVGGPVDSTRGAGYIRREREEDPTYRFVPMSVLWLARPRPFREKACMATGTPWWRRLGRQLVRRRTAQTCCWYHGGDWHKVSTVAIDLVDRAYVAGVPHEDVADFAFAQVDRSSLTDWEVEAVYSLLAFPIDPGRGRWPRNRGYVNGQHRAQAMLDAGVRRTLVERLEQT
ncbi:hypothetical protein [Virgisporangium aurantiacum]|uniref:hypothetical protein n=1 Tax=Virgisporangium aurantiacum TaxID=175570 RepID=UPI001950D385|nr:hypothetical protein [Virgisporangium aurantiacum]